MEIMATSKNYGKKGSDHFRDILNPYGEKSNYGKIGRRRRLSKLNVFFSIILSVTIFLWPFSIAMLVYQRVCDRIWWFPIHGTSKSSMVLSDFPWNHPAMGVPPCLWKPPRFEILNWWGWPMEYPKLRDRNGFLWELRENPQISWFNIVLHLSVHLPAFHGHKRTWNSIF